ncbi:hypothetical protein FRC11_014908 [Ceratobasidium sp. 423]|nr:hypothetical protein FRC11_014908 [Ceratobasidium sp. 423]
MPRLWTLLTLAALSASVVPALSLDSGRYTICQNEIDGETFCLTSLYGPDEVLQMRRLGDAPSQEHQLWDVNTLEGNSFTFKNVKYDCEAFKGGNGIPVLLCGGDQSGIFRATLLEGSRDTYYIDSPDEEPTRMCYEPPVEFNNVTFTVSEDQTPFTQFVFEKAAGGA